MTTTPVTRHAVLYHGNEDDAVRFISVLYIKDGAFAECRVPENQTLEQIADIALQHRITHLWVFGGYTYPDAQSHDEYSIKAYERNRKIATISVWKRGSGHVDILYAQNTAWSPIISNASPKPFLIALRYLSMEIVGVPVAGSPGAIGWNYLKLLRPDWIEDVPDINLKECHFGKEAGKDIIWQRSLSGDENKKKYLHKFDGNSEYPYALTTTDIGTGTPIHLVGKEASDAAIHEKRHPQEVGVWLCSVSGSPTHAEMPVVYRVITPDTRWLSGPMIRLHRAMGYDVRIEEGWVFPNRHDVLAQWANLLWKSRQALLIDRVKYKHIEGATLAASMTKFVANATVGFTAFRGFEDEDEEKRRPDIRLQAVTRSAEIVWHNIDKVRNLYGLVPVMVYMDAMYYLSDDPDGFPAREHFQKREKAFGGFKYCGHIELSQHHTYIRKNSDDTSLRFDNILGSLLATSHGVGVKLEVLNSKGWVK